MSAVLAPTVDAYLAEAIADELKIAALLGWGNLPTLAQGLASGYAMFGTDGGERGHGARLGSKPMPRWRRSWEGAGELIARCEMTVVSANDAAIVDQPHEMDAVVVPYADHPTKDDAIRAAICQAAIAYLTADRTAA